MTDLENAITILVKPHPLNGDDWVRRSIDRLRARVPEAQVVLADNYHYYPIELVLAPFSVVACGGIGSSSLRTLRRIYGLRSYCPTNLMLELYASDPLIVEAMKVWIQDVGTELIHV
jgi:hypothetical protein